MPYRERFACLWCGSDWETRGADDLEGWAALCADCLGKADESSFLRFRLRAGLRDRAAASQAAAVVETPAPIATTEATPAASAHDDWYTRGGRFSRGPLHDGPWSMELDEVTRWLDAQPIAGTIVELAPGTGWWSTLLAEKGELWLYDADGDALDAARRRLMGHGLLAHIHERDPLAAPQAAVDVVVSAYLLGGSSTRDALIARLGVVRAWLKPGGVFVFVDIGDTGPGPVDGPTGPLWPRDIETLTAALVSVGLEPEELDSTQGAFVMGRCRAAA